KLLFGIRSDISMVTPGSMGTSDNTISIVVAASPLAAQTRALSIPVSSVICWTDRPGVFNRSASFARAELISSRVFMWHLLSACLLVGITHAFLVHRCLSGAVSSLVVASARRLLSVTRNRRLFVIFSESVT